MKKSILFVESTGVRRIALKEMIVDLEALTGTARRLAELVSTLENPDDLSKVRIICNKSNRELYIAEGKTKEEAERIDKHWPELLDLKPSMIWRWNSLRKNETPEEYFIRQAKAIDSMDGEIEGGGSEDR